MSTSSDRPDGASRRCGRPKSDLPADAQPDVLALKQYLRTVVGDAKLETVAFRSSFAISTVSAVISGPTLPPLQQVLSVAAGMKGSSERARELWYAAALRAFEASLPKHPRRLEGFGIELRRAMLKEDLGPAEIRRRMVSEAAKFDVRPMSTESLRKLLSGTCDNMPKIVQMDLLLSVLPLQPDEQQRLKARHRVLSEALVIAKDIVSERQGNLGEAA